MLTRYEYLPRIKFILGSIFLIPMVQNIHLQAKRKSDNAVQPPTKKRSIQQIKAADIHPTTDLDQAEYFFEKGKISPSELAACMSRQR